MTSQSRDYLSLNDKIFHRQYILLIPALFDGQSTELLAKSCILVSYQFMLIITMSHDSLELHLQHFHHIFLKSSHDEL